MSSSNVTNTSVVPIESTLSPYYNDYNEADDYYANIFRPGYAVQARELTQIGTFAQVQTERLGRFLFTNGSIVSGGQLSYDQAISLNLQTQYANSDINVNNFIGKKITYASGNNDVQAQVITAANTSNTDPPTLMIKYLTGQEFIGGDTIMVANTAIFANVATSGYKANGLTAAISDGIFFINGYFVRNFRQTLLVSKYTPNANVKVGLEYEDDIVDENSDTNLLDPAQESSNYQAPGAARYRIGLTLAKRSLDSTDDTKFIELSRLKLGVQQKVINLPIFSDIEDTFARRTFDESGNYTVNPFQLELKDDPDNSANLIARLDPGKAYIFGYEYQTVIPTDISVPRTRDTETISNYDISTAYGNYVVTSNTKGFIDISTMPVADLHAVPWIYANNANANVYNSTKIGTTRIRNVLYDPTTGNTSNGLLYSTRLYIFDNRMTSLSANATGGTSNTIIMNANTISANDNTYNRGIITLTAGPGVGDQKTILSYNGATKTATIQGTFSATPTANTQFVMGFNFSEVESIIVGTGGGALTANVNIALASKDDGTSTGNTIISEPSYSSIIFPFPKTYIKSNTSINNYQYRKVFSGRTFTAGSGTITAAAGESLIGTGALSDTIKLTNYLVIVQSNTANLQTGQILPLVSALGASVTVAGSTATINANRPGDTFTADVIADINIESGTESNPKSKTLVSANTTAFVGGASNGSFITASSGANATVYLNAGQVSITTPNKVPAVKDSLYISDIKTLQKIYDLNGTSPTTGLSLASFTDVTNKFTLDNEQQDTYYDHGSIILKPGYTAPKGPLVICVDYYTHDAGTSDGKGFFSIDSYPNINDTAGYAAVPYYTDNRGNEFRLSDVIDFRPKRINASNTSPGFTLQNIRIPTPNEIFTVTFEYYLARQDIIVLSKNRTFSYIQGVSAQEPFPPNDPEDGMVLYRLALPPYILNTANVIVSFVENKRYTMRDIGKLEQRIQNMEYYETLNTLEQNATNMTITDVNGLERTKYGIIADNFTGHQFGDITNLDYRCSMDFIAGQLRPFFSTTAHNMQFGGGDSAYRRNGTTVTLDYSEAEFITQNNASTAVNVQPYLIAKFIGTGSLIPAADTWVNTDQRPDVLVNLSGSNDAWQALETQLNQDVFGTEWNAWQTHWTGTRQTSQTAQSALHTVVNPVTGVRMATRTTTTTTTQVGTQTRTGQQTSINFDSVTQSLGSRVLDVSIIPFIRSRELMFVAHNMRPTRQVYYFFDEVDILSYVQKPNIIKLTSSQSFVTKEGVNEQVSIGSNTAQVLLSRLDTDGNTLLYVANTIGGFLPGVTITGNTSGNTSVVAFYDHFSANAGGGTTTTINLAFGAANTANYYSGNTIYLVAGQGMGQNSSIASYNAVTRVATVSPAFTNAPLANTKYSIGIHKTTPAGSIGGTFIIPSTDALKFRTGQRIFRIIDNNINDLDNITTRTDIEYVAQGLVQTTQNQSVSTQQPTLTVRNLSQTVPVSRVTGVTRTTQWIDPLAETILVDKAQYPDGVFISAVDLFFKTKDDNLPVWIEIRPTTNGYPDSTIVLPYSRTTVFPTDVKISDNPNAANANTLTTFTFSNPIYLLPGQEYALVVQSNSLNYEAYISEMGKTRIGTDRIISEQPYLGSFFESQNSSTWTPFQEKDLMFVMRKCNFVTGPANVYFNNQTPSSNAFMDWMYLQTNSIYLANTQLTYAFKSTNASDLTVDSGFTEFNPDTNYKHNRRKIIHNLSEGSMNVRATLFTFTPDISPVLDITKYSTIAIQNIINNANLSNTNIVLTNDGTGYTATNVTITITGGTTGDSANAYVAAVAGGNITSIIVDTPGSYYTGTANIAFTGGGPSVNATGVIVSELNPSGGPALSKYITRKVILAEGFDAGDLRTFITAYKPIGTQIVVYYKVKNANDPTHFELLPYKQMVQQTPSNRYSVSSINEDDLIEYEFRPSSNSDSITYTTASSTFNTFNEFAIKIVLLSDDTITIPVLENFRTIALPGG